MIDTSRGRRCLRFGNWLWGIEHSRIQIANAPYMDRWILYLGKWGFRLHKFYRGDDDVAPHDHPFWFITIPLGTGYCELVYGNDDVGYFGGMREWLPSIHWVAPWRPHFRPHTYRHIVIYPGFKPFWTFCIFGFVRSDWGFWPDPDTKILWSEFKTHTRDGVSHAA